MNTSTALVLWSPDLYNGFMAKPKPMYLYGAENRQYRNVVSRAIMHEACAAKAKIPTGYDIARLSVVTTARAVCTECHKEYDPLQGNKERAKIAKLLAANPTKRTAKTTSPSS